jgi:hypothetical protein
MDPRWAGQLGWVLLAWSMVYIVDYGSTIVTARLYRQGAHLHIVFDGSMELTPAFQDDVNRLRWVSPRFLVSWAGSSAGLTAIWWISVRFFGWVQPMQFVAGALLLREAAILLRHARNLLVYLRARTPQQMEGTLAYRRSMMLFLSGGELWSFAVFYALLGATLSSWFMAGGAFACLVTGWQHVRMSRQARPPGVPENPAE